MGTVLQIYESFLKHKTTKTFGSFNFDDIWQCGFTYLFILCRSLIGLWFIGLLAPSDFCNTLMKSVYIVAKKPSDPAALSVNAFVWYIHFDNGKYPVLYSVCTDNFLP